VLFLPVGVNDLFLAEAFNKVRDFDKKENIILSLGRIGEPIKNHEMILQALTKIEMKDWKMIFVGPVNENFSNYFNELSKVHPIIKEKVVFTGRINDRVELYEWYNKSKVFCMTSWHESFCHAIGEAFYFGNYIVGTEGIMSMKDITDSGKYGITLKADDDKALANTFQSIINNQTAIKELYTQRIVHSHKYFIWSEIINKLNTQINKINYS
jgi:glycosyltransferase involved in cell wall biosynthesis